MEHVAASSVESIVWERVGNDREVLDRILRQVPWRVLRKHGDARVDYTMKRSLFNLLPNDVELWWRLAERSFADVPKMHAKFAADRTGLIEWLAEYLPTGPMTRRDSYISCIDFEEHLPDGPAREELFKLKQYAFFKPHVDAVRGSTALPQPIPWLLDYVTSADLIEFINKMAPKPSNSQQTIKTWNLMLKECVPTEYITWFNTVIDPIHQASKPPQFYYNAPELAPLPKQVWGQILPLLAMNQLWNIADTMQSIYCAARSNASVQLRGNKLTL